MIYLLLAILCSSSIALIFKYSETNEMNRYAVTTINYFTAFAVSFIMVLSSGIFSVETSFKNVNFKSEFISVVIKSQGIFTISSSIMWAVIVGIIAGLFFFLSFIYYQKSVKENGVSLSGTFGKLGILIPMCFSIVLWHEFPTSFQWVGIGLSLLSILITNFSIKEVSLKNMNVTLLLLFIFGGMAEFANKIFQNYAQVAYKEVFLFFVFFTAFLISLYFTLKSKVKVSIRDVLIGFLVGFPNLFSSYFLILALNSIKTSVAFPAYSAGSIVLITIGGFLLFKERLKKKELFSIILTIIALILINLK